MTIAALKIITNTLYLWNKTEWNDDSISQQQNLKLHCSKQSAIQDIKKQLASTKRGTKVSTQIPTEMMDTNRTSYLPLSRFGNNTSFICYDTGQQCSEATILCYTNWGHLICENAQTYVAHSNKKGKLKVAGKIKKTTDYTVAWVSGAYFGNS